MEFSEWFAMETKNKFDFDPDELTYYDDDYGLSCDNGEGVDIYISFLEERLEFLYNELMNKKS